MDFLNKASSQVRELFLSMTPAARMTTGLLLAVVVISLVFLVSNFNSSGSEYLFGGYEFSHNDLVAIEKAFGTAGLREYEINGTRIKVPHNERDVYLAAVPKEFSLKPGAYYDKAFDADGPFTSAKQREERLRRAKEEKLGRVLEQFQWIENSTVELSESDGVGFPRRKEKSALVAVKPYGQRYLESTEVKAIRDAIAYSEAGLDRADVAVLDVNQGYTHLGPSEAGMPGASESLYASHKRMFEEMWRKKIEHNLRYYPGVVVGVNVELDPEVKRNVTKREFDPKPVVVNSAESTKSTSSRPAETGGRPGLASNGGNSNQPAYVNNTPGQESTTEQSDSTTLGVTSQTDTVSQTVGLVPNKVSATVGVPSSFYEKVWQKKWRQQNPDGQEPEAPTPDDLKRIETDVHLNVTQIVEAVLKDVGLGDDKRKNVVVRTDEDLPLEPMPEPSLADTALAWFSGHWQTLGMFVLGAFGLLVLRRMVRSLPTVDSGPESTARTQLELGNASEESHEQEAKPAESMLKQDRFGSGPNLRQELTELVKEDPDAAANILRNWLGDAA